MHFGKLSFFNPVQSYKLLSIFDKLNIIIMNEDQADTIIDLLSEISSKLSNINQKINGDRDLSHVLDKLDTINDNLQSIDSNTSRIE